MTAFLFPLCALLSIPVLFVSSRDPHRHLVQFVCYGSIAAVLFAARSHLWTVWMSNRIWHRQNSDIERARDFLRTEQANRSDAWWRNRYVILFILLYVAVSISSCSGVLNHVVGSRMTWVSRVDNVVLRLLGAIGFGYMILCSGRYAEKVAIFAGGYCERCGYHLGGLDNVGTCPECGSAYDLPAVCERVGFEPPDH
ncbi:MAG: hypothetical protein AAGD00_01620 [Planctomycetota bacterium]